MRIARSDIVLINFDPSVGHEIRKIRPAVVIQNNTACKHSPILTVIPFSSKPYSGKIFEVLITKNKTNMLLKDSVLLINQIMTFDKSRIVKKLGKVNKDELNQIFKKIDIHFGRKKP